MDIMIQRDGLIIRPPRVIEYMLGGRACKRTLRPYKTYGSLDSKGYLQVKINGKQHLVGGG